MSMLLEAFGVMVSRVSPTAVELSVVTGVGPGCGCPISSSVTRRGIASLQPWKSDAISVSDADAMTCLMMADRMSTAPL